MTTQIRTQDIASGTNVPTATALETARNIDGQSFDGTGNITVIAPGTHAASSKATPVDADELPLVDSAASNVLKKLTWANVKATLKTYFDTLYSATGAYAPGGTDVAVADGGTGASTAATARTNLGIPGAVGGVEWTVVTKASDESVNSGNTGTTAQADDELFFTPASGGLYDIEIDLIYASPVGGGTPDIKASFYEDATVRGILSWTYLTTTDAAGDTPVRCGSGSIQSAGTAATKRMIHMRGWYVGTGTQAGVFWAQNTSDANNTTVYAGSVLRYRRII